MNYYLDFDRTIFNTEAFYEHLASRSLIHLVGTTTIFMTLDDVSPFVYADAREFIASQPPARVSVVSMYDAEGGEEAKGHQAGMIERSGVITRAHEVTLVPGLKNEVLKDAPAGTFVDDMPEQLRAVAADCSHMKCIRMQRPGSKYADEPAPEFVTITSFAELTHDHEE